MGSCSQATRQDSNGPYDDLIDPGTSTRLSWIITLSRHSELHPSAMHEQVAREAGGDDVFAGLGASRAGAAGFNKACCGGTWSMHLRALTLLRMLLFCFAAQCPRPPIVVLCRKTVVLEFWGRALPASPQARLMILMPISPMMPFTMPLTMPLTLSRQLHADDGGRHCRVLAVLNGVHPTRRSNKPQEVKLVFRRGLNHCV